MTEVLLETLLERLQRKLSLPDPDSEELALLADELSQGDTAEGDAANESQQILKNYLVKKDQAETDDHYIYQYLDLVDETNGRAWVTADRPVDVYWKLPKGSDSNDDFKLVHFTGLDLSLIHISEPTRH